MVHLLQVARREISWQVNNHDNPNVEYSSHYAASFIFDGRASMLVLHSSAWNAQKQGYSAQPLWIV